MEFFWWPSLRALLFLSRAIDALNTFIGRTVSWLILVAVVISAGNAVVRKVLSTSSNAWLELQWYLFGAVFLLAAAWTLICNEHIRIDVVSSRFPRRLRNWIEILGHTLFLLPFCILLLIDSWPFFLKSYLQNEQSMNAGGLVVWPAKLLVVVGFALLFLQGISELIKRIAIMRGLIPDPHADSFHEQVEAQTARPFEPATTGGTANRAKP
ncbi:TRAP transporter small permease subunit [Phreatobacter sp.]|uniref:TRAP transporter small permease subunit n=1 Tax=Phreatobacter sp. TaxID=1966341 RepID=UPI003F704568